MKNTNFKKKNLHFSSNYLQPAQNEENYAKLRNISKDVNSGKSLTIKQDPFHGSNAGETQPIHANATYTPTALQVYTIYTPTTLQVYAIYTPTALHLYCMRDTLAMQGRAFCASSVLVFHRVHTESSSKYGQTSLSSLSSLSSLHAQNSTFERAQAHRTQIKGIP